MHGVNVEHIDDPEPLPQRVWSLEWSPNTSGRAAHVIMVVLTTHDLLDTSF
jgi:hypothetical protein